MQANFENIRIVLVRTFHAGNIGSAVRSMKTMGLSDIVLVSPVDFPSPEANKMAAGAEDMLNNIRVVETLTEAISDCTLVVASTARPRGYDLPELTPQGMAENMLTTSNSSPVALIFGPERMGLHNADIQHAKYRVTIPTNPDYNSLNIASAVQILCYEIYKLWSDKSNSVKQDSKSHQSQPKELPTSKDIELLIEHTEQTLNDISFLRSHQGETMQRIRNLLSRGEPDVVDTNILRGILSAINKTKP